ncbi:hypothetical protein L6R52_31330, partial [Myxococcota bacterium]|nr:hypothetical protein [Myxococcota bacterium]
ADAKPAAEGAAKDEPAKVEPVAEAAKPAEPVAEPTKTVEPTNVVAEAPAGPKPLGASFALSAPLTVVRVDAGVSKARSKDALERHAASAIACVRSAVAAGRVHTSGQVRLEGQIDERGKLRNLKASGLPAASACLEDAFAPARMPAPDTGQATILFTIDYTTNEG